MREILQQLAAAWLKQVVMQRRNLVEESHMALHWHLEWYEVILQPVLVEVVVIDGRFEIWHCRALHEEADGLHERDEALRFVHVFEGEEWVDEADSGVVLTMLLI